MKLFSNSSRFLKSGILLPALIATALWGSAFPAIKVGYALFQIEADNLFSKLLFAGIRFSGAGILVLLAGAFLYKSEIIPRKQQLPGLVLLGLVQTGIMYAFYYVGLGYTPGTRASVITGSTSLFSVLFAHFLCKGEKMTSGKTLGCLLGFAGIIFAAGSGLGGAFTLLGDGFLLISSAFSGIGFCISKLISAGRNPFQVSGFQLLFGGLFLIAISLPATPSLPFSTRGALLMFYLMFLSAVGFAIWTALLKNYSVGKVSLYNFLIPLFGTVFSGIFLGENFLHLRFLVALLLVCSGIAIVNVKR